MARTWLYRSSLFTLAAGFVTLPTWAQMEPIKITRTGYTVEVTVGARPFTTYNFDPKIAKAYLQPVRDADGAVVTRSFPVMDVVPPEHEHDPSVEPHQRGVYFGHGDINGYNFWAEETFKKYYGHDVSSNYGRMVFRKIDEMHGGSNSGKLRATFDLEGPDEKPFAQEVQEYTFSGDKSTRIMDCEITIRAGKQPVKFGDTKEGTFAIRLAPELDAPQGTMVSSEDGEGEPQIWGKRANWVNVDGMIDGHELGVAIFDHPKSFRHPTSWHARGYGLLAANPFGLSYFLRDAKQDGSYTIPAGESIQFRYRLLIHKGDYKEAQVAKQYDEYAARP